MYRLVFPATVLAAQGMDVAEGRREDIQAVWRRTQDGPRVAWAEPLDCDVAVFQRVCRRDIVDCIPSWQRQGTAVVMDVDDLLSAVDPGNPAFAAYHPSSGAENWHHLERACRMADMVTVSTPALAERYGRHGRVRVLRNCVPEWYLSVHAPGAQGSGSACGSARHRQTGALHKESQPAPTVLGWAGRVDVHAADLAVVGTAVAQALRQTGATFRAVGDAATLTTLGVEGEVVPFMPFEDYPVQVARLDVGMAPLADTAFNRGKSFLKPLEMAALGVPFVASPLPEYARLAELGAGDLASRPRQWLAALRRLLTDAEYRAERAGRGREVAAGLTYEAHADGWAAAWSEPLKARREAALCR
jgi:hypothetical protein